MDKLHGYIFFSFFPENWPFLVKINVLISMLICIAAFAVMALILITRINKNIREKRKLTFTRISEQFLSTILFDHEYGIDEQWLTGRIHVFKQMHLHSAEKKDIMFTQIYILYCNYTGVTRERLRLLFDKLDLYEYAIYEIRSKQWNRVAKSINYLAEIGIPDGLDLIRPFVNHPNPSLRLEAQVALVKLERTEPLKFFQVVEKPLTEWQQIQLANALDKYRSVETPLFGQWLNHNVDSVVIFCLKMIASEQQFQYTAQMISMLSHSNERIKKELIISLRKLENSESLDLLVEMYPEQSAEIKIEILKNIMQLGNVHHYNFLKREMDHQEDFNIRLAAAKAMVNLTEGKQYLQKVAAEGLSGLREIALHAADHRI